MNLSYRLPKPSPHSGSGLWIWGIVTEIMTVVLSFWAGTQYIAWKFRFAPALGKPSVHIEFPWTLYTAIIAGAVFLWTCQLFWYQRLWQFRWWWIWTLFFSLSLGVIALMPIYPPWMWIVWMWNFGNTAGTRTWWETVLHIFLVAHLAPLFSVFLQVARSRQFDGETDMHGSARFATRSEILSSALINNDGVYIGAIEE